MSEEYITGAVKGIGEKETSTGKPKKVLELAVEGKDKYPTRINFSGRDLDELASVKVGQVIKVGFDWYEIPSGPNAGTKMRLGREVIASSASASDPAPLPGDAPAIQHAPPAAGGYSHYPYKDLVIAYEALAKGYSDPELDPKDNHNRIINLFYLMDAWAVAYSELDTPSRRLTGVMDALGLDLIEVVAWLGTLDPVVFKSKSIPDADPVLAERILANLPGAVRTFRQWQARRAEAEGHTAGGGEAPGAGDFEPGPSKPNDGIPF